MARLLATKRLAASSAVLVALALFGVPRAFAANITVTNTNDSGPGSLRAAIGGAASGDTITFNVTLPATITLTGGAIDITANVTINGPGASNLAVNANHTSGVFRIDPPATNVTLAGLTIENGSFPLGAGLFIQNLGGAVAVNSCVISGNSAPINDGGGIYNAAALTLNDTTISNNSAGFGAGIYNSGAGTVTINNSVISGNTANLGSLNSGDGGGIANYGTVSINNSTVTGNGAIADGGGILNLGTLSITNSTVSANSVMIAGSTGGEGGGIWNDLNDTVTITGSTLSGNIGYSGGAVFNVGTMTFTNSTIAANNAIAGGGFFNENELTLVNSTVSGNAASSAGGGILSSSSTLTLKNTILAVNGSNCLLFVTAVSAGHNISDDSTCAVALTQASDANGTPAGLDPVGLQANGGSTQTIALLASSPAVDAVPTTFCTAIDGMTPIATDQRGIARPQGLACDIGAFEFTSAQADTTPPIVSSVQATPDPVALNSGLTLTAVVDDSTTGSSNIASAQYTVNGGSPMPMLATDGSFDGVNESVTATVAPLSTTGVYNLCVTGTDAAHNTSSPACIPVPVYDPNGGFVTGGGSILSTVGNDLVNSSATGQATFGFVSKYLKGANTPTGNLEFHFDAGNLHFKSVTMDWLVVTGEPRAQFHGTGTINGTSVCQFSVDAWNSSFGSAHTDAFGIKVYSCNSGGDGNGNRYSVSATPLTAGSIIIHK